MRRPSGAITRNVVGFLVGSGRSGLTLIMSGVSLDPTMLSLLTCIRSL